MDRGNPSAQLGLECHRVRARLLPGNGLAAAKAPFGVPSPDNPSAQLGLVHLSKERPPLSRTWSPLRESLPQQRGPYPDSAGRSRVRSVRHEAKGVRGRTLVRRVGVEPTGPSRHRGYSPLPPPTGLPTCLVLPAGFAPALRVPYLHSRGSQPRASAVGLRERVVGPEGIEPPRCRLRAGCSAC